VEQNRWGRKKSVYIYTYIRIHHRDIHIYIYICIYIYKVEQNRWGRKNFITIVRALLYIYIIETYICIYIYIYIYKRTQFMYIYIKEPIFVWVYVCEGGGTWIYKWEPRRWGMGSLWLAGSIKLQVSFAKEPYKRDNILQKRPIILSILLSQSLTCVCDLHIDDTQNPFYVWDHIYIDRIYVWNHIYI